jgi:trimeric autotransporter adhesin
VDGSGNLVITDQANYRVRVVAASTGTFYGQAMTAGDIYTIAGNGSAGYSGDGGPATSAELELPYGVAVDRSGNVVIADTGNNVVRVVAASTGTFYGQAMTAGDIYTVAGNGTAGYSGDGGPGSSAELNSPEGVAVDPAGNLVIADTFNSVVRVVAASTGTFYGQAMTAGDIYTIAGDGTAGYSGNGGPAASAELKGPLAVAFDSAGNLVIADGSDRVRVVAASSGTFYGRAMTAGDIYTVAGDGTLNSSGSGRLAVNAELASGGVVNYVSGVAVDSRNYVVVQNNRAWFICETAGTYFGRAMTAGDIYTVAGGGTSGLGDGGPALSAKLSRPQGVAVDSAGNLVIADTDHNRVRVVAASTGTFYGQAMTAGDIYTVAGNGTLGYSGDGGPATSAELNDPGGVAVDGSGNLVIADSENDVVRVVAASTGTFYGQAMTAGDIYTVAGNGTAGSSGDGGPATSAEFAFPEGVAVDGSGNLVIADTLNGRVRVVAASTGTFYGQAMTAGDIYTVAGGGTSGLGDGGPATSAELSDPEGVAVDSSGNLVIADTLDSRVRVVAASTGKFYGQAMTAGDIYTVAGNGTPGYSGDGGPGTSAELGYPDGVAADCSGNLIIADTQNALVRLVSG